MTESVLARAQTAPVQEQSAPVQDESALLIDESAPVPTIVNYTYLCISL